MTADSETACRSRAVPTVALALLTLVLGLPEPTEAAFELRMSPAARGAAGESWSAPDPDRSGPRLTLRNLRPFQLTGLRFDGVEVGWGQFTLAGGQLGVDGYREHSLSVGFRGPEDRRGAWIRGELFRSGPSDTHGSFGGLGGVRSRGGAALSGGWGLEMGSSRWGFAALDLLRTGDVDLPPVAWRVSGVWSPDPRVELRVDREWEGVGHPWDGASLLWEAMPRLRVKLGLEDREPIVACEIRGSGLGVRLWARSHAGLAPTAGIELRLQRRSASDPAAGPPDPRLTTSASTSQARAAAPDLSMIDAPSPWELEPEEAAVLERPWEVADSLTVWEVREVGSPPGGIAFRNGSGSARRAVVSPSSAEPLSLPVHIEEIATLTAWPSVEDSVWRARRASWRELWSAGAIRDLSDLRELPPSELEFWRPWIPYLTARTEPPEGIHSPRADARSTRPLMLETRVRTRNGLLERQVTWSARAEGLGAAWTVAGVRESSRGTPRASLRGAGRGWRVRSDWGSVRPRIGLDVDLGRTAIGAGGLVAGEVHGRGVRLGGRLAKNGGDFLLGWNALSLAASTGGLWQLRLGEDASGLDLIRANDAVWFVRTAQTFGDRGGSLRVQATERLHGAAALSRSEARSLRFDRRANWRRILSSFRTQLDLRWRKSAADGALPLAIPEFVPASTETREIRGGVSGRSGRSPWSADLRVRRTASRSAGGVAARTTSVHARHRGSWSEGKMGSNVPRFGWEIGMSGALRVGNDRIQSWFALYQERSTSLGVVSLGLCEVRGSSGSRGTLDVSWSLLRPRSVAANSRWAVGTVESGAGAVRFTGSGAVPLGVPEEDPSWEIRIRIEPLLPLSRRSDPG